MKTHKKNQMTRQEKEKATHGWETLCLKNRYLTTISGNLLLLENQFEIIEIVRCALEIANKDQHLDWEL